MSRSLSTFALQCPQWLWNQSPMGIGVSGLTEPQVAASPFVHLSPDRRYSPHLSQAFTEKSHIQLPVQYNTWRCTPKMTKINRINILMLHLFLWFGRISPSLGILLLSRRSVMNMNESFHKERSTTDSLSGSEGLTSMTLDSVSTGAPCKPRS